eukprot:1159211-Pelagomonas_calceolata.AAC.22
MDCNHFGLEYTENQTLFFLDFLQWQFWQVLLTLHACAKHLKSVRGCRMITCWCGIQITKASNHPSRQRLVIELLVHESGQVAWSGATIYAKDGDTDACWIGSHGEAHKSRDVNPGPERAPPWPRLSWPTPGSSAATSMLWTAMLGAREGLLSSAKSPEPSSPKVCWRVQDGGE